MTQVQPVTPAARGALADPTPRRVPLSGALVLGALAIDVGGTRWGSYLQVPGVPVFLPDLMLLSGALLAVRKLDKVSRAGVLASFLLAAFCVLQLARSTGAPLALAVRDLSPFVYLGLVPFVALALRDVPPALFLRVVRWASLFLAATVAARLVGVLPTISVPFGGVPIFSAREDAEAVVLAVGIVAFGRWPGVARDFRSVQIVMALLAAASYSRAGLIAAAVCVGIASWRERQLLSRPASRVAVAAVAVAVSAAALGLVAVGLENSPVPPPQAVERLLESEASSGTTNARIGAWGLLIRYTNAKQQVMFGEGPGTGPVWQSGAVRYLSGDPSVRAAHNWPINAVAYFGLVGFLLWTGVVVVLLSVRTGAPVGALAVAALAAYLVAALFGVIIESPFGSLPVAVMLGWLVGQGRPWLGTSRPA